VAVAVAKNRKVTFAGSGGDLLDARLDLPDGPPRAVALFAHCFTCSKESLAAARISRGLTDLGFAVLRFDFTGLGQSGGDFANTTFSSNVEDLVAAADHLRATLSAPSVLIGHSLGGAAVLAAAGRVPEVRAVVTLCAPADPAHVAHLLVGAQDEIQAAGEAAVLLGGRTFRIRREFLSDIAAQPQRDRIATLDRPLLVMHSPQDEVVGIENARLIFDAARHPKSFISLDGVDHLVTRRADATYVAGVIAAWAVRYLPEPEDSAPDTAAAPAESDVVVVAEAGTGPYAQRITIGRHELTADEPPPIGGDTGPTPYDLLLAGLGACTSMTLRMYAERKGLALRHTTVRLRHERIYAKDCAACETETGRLDHIEREIQLDGDLTDDERATLMDIADRCPVHRTLHEEVVISSRLADRIGA
jgi:uncharacterized OsmC-like protein/fermentation-respiration switch protein FrsA (DUF1100 family)